MNINGQIKNLTKEQKFIFDSCCIELDRRRKELGIPSTILEDPKKFIGGKFSTLDEFISFVKDGNITKITDINHKLSDVMLFLRKINIYMNDHSYREFSYKEFNIFCAKYYNDRYRNCSLIVESMDKKPSRKRYFLKTIEDRKISIGNFIKINIQNQDNIISKKKNYSIVKSKNNDHIKDGFVYVISNPHFPGWVKIGSTFDLNSRLISYQSYCPYGMFRYEYYHYFSDRIYYEKECHRLLKEFIGNGEWFNISPEKAKSYIINLYEKSIR